MRIRTQLLIAFVGVTLLSLLIFGTVAYWLLPDAVRTHDALVLKGLSQQVALRLDQTEVNGGGDDATLSALRRRLTGPDMLIALQNTSGHVLAASRPDDMGRDPKAAARHERLVAAVHGITHNADEDGLITFAGRQFIWASSRVPGTANHITLLHPVTLDWTRFGNTLWTRLLATALFVIWVAVWAALVLSSVIARRLNEKNTALAHQAHHDSLTGLPNRSLLNSHLNALIRDTEHTENAIALFVMDLDRFREVNDTLGHPFGDQLLKLVGMRVRGVLREGDMIARLGGDEFAVVLPSANRKQAIGCAKRIVQVLEQPFSFDGFNLHVKTSLGIAVYPEHGNAVDALIQHADTAMYKAKKAGVDYRFYDSNDDPHSLRRLTLTGDLRTAIERNQLVLHYQPKMDMRTGQPRGVEALVRWQHPAHGLIPPDEFIPLAEQTGLIGPLTDWVLSEAVRQCSTWRQQGNALSVAVNLSAHNLKNAQLPAEIAAMLQAWDVQPAQLMLEITESAMTEDYELAAEIVRRLDEMGICIAIDDFGTGFSSLAYLQRLPVHELKIDKSFVIGMDGAENESNVVIVRSIVDLAHNIGCEVVAEGVETESIRDRLATLGCDIAQGYFFSRPLPQAALRDWLSGREGAQPGADPAQARWVPAVKPA